MSAKITKSKVIMPTGHIIDPQIYISVHVQFNNVAFFWPKMYPDCNSPSFSPHGGSCQRSDQLFLWIECLSYDNRIHQTYQALGLHDSTSVLSAVSLSLLNFVYLYDFLLTKVECQSERVNLFGSVRCRNVPVYIKVSRRFRKLHLHAI